MPHVRRHRHHLPLLVLAVAAAFCAARAAAEAPQTSAASRSTVLLAQAQAPGALTPDLDAAKGGNGGGKGKGKGGNGGNGGKGNKPGGALSLEIQPDHWNTNWAHSNGTVSAFIRGANLGQIHLDSIVLVGTDAAEDPVEPLRAERHGNHIRAFFAKDDALDSLDTPTPGEVHEVAVEFTMGDANTEVSLTDRVRVVGPADDDDDDDDEGEEEAFDLAIQPDAWNLNWAHSNGTVTALIRGDGLADVDLTSIELVGTDPTADPLPALRAELHGNHIRAFFAKDDALATLDTPKRGEVHEIIIRLKVAGADEELTDKVRVVGPAN